MTATEERRRVGHFEIHLTCPRCGGQVEPIAEGRPTQSGTQIQAIVRCPACRNHRFQLIALLRSASEEL